MSEVFGYEANLRRGQLLRETGHDLEALPFLREAIAANPQQPQPYLELALALSELPGKKEEALRAAERSVALAPTSPHYIGYRAYILAHLADYQEALQVAAAALQLDPNRRIALLAQANAYTKTAQWVAAEVTARRMLALDAQDTAGLNLLAQALRFQGRNKDSREVVRQILALVPEDAFAQANAGFEALNAGDYERAQRHFVNSLRVNPHSDNARRGLLQSLRDRVWFYRMNAKAIVFFDNLHKKRLWLRMLLVFSVVGTCGGVLFLWLIYLPLALLLQPISNFFLMLEPAGRRALPRKDKFWAVAAFAALVVTMAFFIVVGLQFLACFIGLYLALFVLSVYVPQAISRWRAWRDEIHSVTKLAPYE